MSDIKLDLETLKYIKFTFDLHSDHSTMCNGYRSLCDKIKTEELKLQINNGCCENPSIQIFMENTSGKDIGGNQLYGATTRTFKCVNCGKFQII